MIPRVNQLIHLLAELGVVVAVHSPADADDHHRPVQRRTAVCHDEALADRGIHAGCATLLKYGDEVGAERDLIAILQDCLAHLRPVHGNPVPAAAVADLPPPIRQRRQRGMPSRDGL